MLKKIQSSVKIKIELLDGKQAIVASVIRHCVTLKNTQLSNHHTYDTNAIF